MFKLLFPYRKVNYLQYLVVRLTSKKNYEYNVKSENCLTKTSQFYNNRRNNSSDSRVRNFYEYPDLNPNENENKNENENENENQPPYTNWEGVENRYAHSIMENNKSYGRTIALIPNSRNPNLQHSESEIDDLIKKNYRLEPVSNLVSNFRIVSLHAKFNNSNIYDEKYDNIINYVTQNSKILTDDQICDVLQSLMLWFVEINQDDTSFSLLYKSLDSECESRAKFWSVREILFVSDHWYRLRLIKRSKFMVHAIMKLGKNPAILSSRNVVQLMFYTSVLRNGLINFKEIEAHLKANFKYLDINEIGIIALGFFKSQTMMRDRTLLTMIIQKTIKEIDKINEISLAAILKIVRYSIHINDLDFLCKLLENTIPQIPRLSVTCLVHVILAAADKSLFYAELLNAVTAKFYGEISKVRVKDIRCLMFALSSFNFVPEKQPNIFDRVIEELNETNRQDELKRFPKCFATCLHHLSILNIHPKNLIAQALDPESIQKAYGTDENTIRREILALDLDIEAEIPDYRGPRLDTQTRENVAMRLTNCPPWDKTSHLTVADHFMLDVIKSCEEYLGSRELIHVDHVLPQYQRPDIIICFDKTNSAVPLSSTLSKLPFGSVKHPPKIYLNDDIRWMALVIGSNNSYAKNTKRLLGHICAKHRQLQHIGYTPFIIYWQDWIQLRNDAEKLRYLQCEVFF